MLRGGEADKVNYLFPTIPDEQPGSNAWVVSGAYSATGRPLLSNDTHLEYSIPGIWYAAHLEAPRSERGGCASRSPRHRRGA